MRTGRGPDRSRAGCPAACRAGCRACRGRAGTGDGFGRRRRCRPAGSGPGRAWGRAARHPGRAASGRPGGVGLSGVGLSGAGTGVTCGSVWPSSGCSGAGGAGTSSPEPPSSSTSVSSSITAGPGSPSGSTTGGTSSLEPGSVPASCSDEVRGAVAVGVVLGVVDAVVVGVGLPRVRGRLDLDAVAQAVAVGVLVAVVDAVAVGVRAVRLGPDVQLGQVVEAVAVGVAGRVGGVVGVEAVAVLPGVGQAVAVAVVAGGRERGRAARGRRARRALGHAEDAGSGRAPSRRRGARPRLRSRAGRHEAPGGVGRDLARGAVGGQRGGGGRVRGGLAEPDRLVALARVRGGGAFQASSGATSAARVSTVAIMPAETSPAKRRSDRRRWDAGRRELSICDMRECLFTDYVGRVAHPVEPLGRCWTFVGCPWTKFAAPPRPSPPPGGAPTRSCAGSSRMTRGPIARCAGKRSGSASTRATSASPPAWPTARSSAAPRSTT